MVTVQAFIEINKISEEDIVKNRKFTDSEIIEIINKNNQK